MTPQKQPVVEWSGRTLVDREGDKVGKIGEIYLDQQTGEPEWVLVKTGLFGTRSTFVPISGATESGEDIRVSYEKSQIKDAPNVEADGQLSPDEERQLYAHYGRDDYDARTSEDRTATDGRSGRTLSDEAMTRSEEELEVGTQRREAGRARLRKYVVTENVTKTVPVQREEVRVEREPITDANVDEALEGPEISEAEHEVVLHEEEPVVQKRAVPKERVRLEKDVVTDEETVSQEIRKERIDTEGDAR